MATCRREKPLVVARASVFIHSALKTKTSFSGDVGIVPQKGPQDSRSMKPFPAKRGYSGETVGSFARRTGMHLIWNHAKLL